MKCGPLSFQRERGEEKGHFNTNPLCPLFRSPSSSLLSSFPPLPAAVFISSEAGSLPRQTKTHIMRHITNLVIYTFLANSFRTIWFDPNFTFGKSRTYVEGNCRSPYVHEVWTGGKEEKE